MREQLIVPYSDDIGRNSQELLSAFRFGLWRDDEWSLFSQLWNRNVRQGVVGGVSPRLWPGLITGIPVRQSVSERLCIEPPKRGLCCDAPASSV